MSKTESDHIKNLDLSDRIWIQILKTPHSTSFQKTGSTTPLVRTGLAGPGNGNQVGGFPVMVRGIQVRLDLGIRISGI